MAIKGIRHVERPRAIPVERMPSVAVAPVECLTGEAFAAEIGRLWRDAQSRFLDIGRRLNEACAKLEHGEYARLLDALPFERATADKLRKVAMAADAGTLAVDQMPASYSTAYELLTLTEPERAAAASAGQYIDAAFIRSGAEAGVPRTGRRAGGADVGGYRSRRVRRPFDSLESV